MPYWLAFPIAMFMLSPVWTGGWGSTYVGDKIQQQEIWDSGAEGDSGQVRTSEGMIGPPRN